MKKTIIAIMLLCPTLSFAQNTWEVPTQKTEVRDTTKRKALFETKKKVEAPKYLSGAVPVVDGKVTFTLDMDVKGKTAQEIYDILYGVLDNMTKEENQFKESKIAIVNKGEHTIAARYKEWLVFRNSALSLDRTVFNYTIIAQATDGHVNVKLFRISYQYELERGINDGIEVVAEEWITDEQGLNKKKDKLAKYSGKFRKKTIDRKDNIFETITNSLR